MFRSLYYDEESDTAICAVGEGIAVVPCFSMLKILPSGEVLWIRTDKPMLALMNSATQYGPILGEAAICLTGKMSVTYVRIKTWTHRVRRTNGRVLRIYIQGGYDYQKQAWVISMMKTQVDWFYSRHNPHVWRTLR